MVGLELIKNYIADEVEEYQYLVDGSTDVKWMGVDMISNFIGVSFIAKEVYCESVNFDTLAIMEYIFRKNQQS